MRREPAACLRARRSASFCERCSRPARARSASSSAGASHVLRRPRSPAWRPGSCRAVRAHAPWRRRRRLLERDLGLQISAACCRLTATSSLVASTRCSVSRSSTLVAWNCCRLTVCLSSTVAGRLHVVERLLRGLRVEGDPMFRDAGSAGLVARDRVRRERGALGLDVLGALVEVGAGVLQHDDRLLQQVLHLAVPHRGLVHLFLDVPEVGLGRPQLGPRPFDLGLRTQQPRGDLVEVVRLLADVAVEAVLGPVQLVVARVVAEDAADGDGLVNASATSDAASIIVTPSPGPACGGRNAQSGDLTCRRNRCLPVLRCYASYCCARR